MIDALGLETMTRSRRYQTRRPPSIIAFLKSTLLEASVRMSRIVARFGPVAAWMPFRALSLKTRGEACTRTDRRFFFDLDKSDYAMISKTIERF
jgi:hypothetical protein